MGVFAPRHLVLRIRSGALGHTRLAGSTLRILSLGVVGPSSGSISDGPAGPLDCIPSLAGLRFGSHTAIFFTGVPLGDPSRVLARFDVRGVERHSARSCFELRVDWPGAPVGAGWRILETRRVHICHESNNLAVRCLCNASTAAAVITGVAGKKSSSFDGACSSGRRRSDAFVGVFSVDMRANQLTFRQLLAAINKQAGAGKLRATSCPMVHLTRFWRQFDCGAFLPESLIQRDTGNTPPA